MNQAPQRPHDQGPVSGLMGLVRSVACCPAEQQIAAITTQFAHVPQWSVHPAQGRGLYQALVCSNNS